MGQSRTLPPRMQNMYQRSHSWNGGGQPWQRPASSSSSSPAVAGERPQHHYQPHRERGERSERVEQQRERQGTPAVHVLPPRMRAVKAPRHQTNTAIDPSFGLVAPPSPPSPSDPLGLGRNLDQLNAARPSIARSYNEVNTSYPPLLNIPAPNVVYATGMAIDSQRTSQLSPEAPVFQPRFGMPASAPLYHHHHHHHSSNVDEFPFPFVGGGGGGGSGSSSASYQGGDIVVGNIGDVTMSTDPALGVSFPIMAGLASPASSSPSTSPTRTSPTGSPPKMTKLPPIAPPPATKPDDNTPPPPAYLVNFLASKFGPASTVVPTVVATPVQEEPSVVLYDSALSTAATITLPVSTVAVPGVTPKMVPSSSSTMSLVPTVPILKLPTPPNKRPASSSASSTPRPAPSPPVSNNTPKTIIEAAPRRPSAPSRSSYIVADMLLNRIRSSPLRPGLGPRRSTSPALSGTAGSTSPISRSCLSKEVMMDDVVMLSLPMSS